MYVRSAQRKGDNVANSTIVLSDEDAATFADIRLKMLALYGPYLWRDLLIAIVDDHLDAACADAAPTVAPWQNELPGWLLSQRRQLEALDRETPEGWPI
jgi:hypothetical protein